MSQGFADFESGDLTKRRSSGLGCASIFLFVALVLIPFEIYRQIEGGLDSPKWPTTEARILTGAMHTSGNHSEWHVTYSYEVDGQKLEGHLIKFNQGLDLDHQALAKKFPVDAVVPVSFDPDEPSRSVLLPGATAGEMASSSTAALMFFVLVFGLGCLFAWDALRVQSELQRRELHGKPPPT